MQKLLLTLVSLVSLWSVATPGQAQSAALPDSVTEKKIVLTVGAEMCRQLEQENAKKPIASLSSTESQQLFMRLIMVSAATSPELMSMFTAQPENAKAYGEQVGTKIGFWLLRECPISQPMLMQLGVQAVTRKNPMTPAEETLFKPMAADVCNDLEARQKKQDLQALPADKRQELLQEVIVAATQAHAKEIMLVYGKNVTKDKKKLYDIGTKLVLQMGTQCPNFVLLFADLK